jgi:hypothetical protein
MFGVGRSELAASRNFDNIKGEDMKELKDTVSGLPSLMTRVSTNVHDIKKTVSSSIDIGSNNYGAMDRNAVSSRIVGLNQLNKNLNTQKKQHRYDNKRFNSPSPNDMLNSQSDLGLNQSIANTAKTKQVSARNWPKLAADST